MQARFLKETDFFNRLAWTYEDVVERALLLLEFCRKRTFLVGEAFEFAQRRVRELVSGTDFRKLYLKDCADDGEAAKRLGSLKARLEQAGLMD
jgi:hypothetical protein